MRNPLILSVKGIELAFGLEWLPLVGADPANLARQLVRRHGATHSVMSGAAGAAVGLAWLGRVPVRREALCSGAQVFALLHPRGTVAALLDLGAQGWCALAAHEGAVLARADKVYVDRDLAAHALEDIRQAYPTIRMLGDSGDSQSALCLEVLADAVGERVMEGARLLRAPRPWWRRPGLWAALAVVLVFSGPRLIAAYSEAGHRTSPGPDAEVAWLRAQSAALRDHRLHGEVGTRTLLGVFYALPVSLAGWRLSQANCVAQVQSWMCKAEYARVGLRADNRGLLRAAPGDWHLEFPTTDRAWVHWTSSMASMSFDQRPLPAPADQDRHWMSALQAIQSAFSRVRVEPSRALPVSAPLGPDRQALPRPAHLRRYGMRSVQITGPLRSANLLISLSAHMAWNKAELTVDEKSAAGRVRSPINLTLDGVLYEMEVPEDPRV